ncbi:MAG: hypothetical protein CM1200mP29_04310 [Verrucomicrobiota bacterium]|nr:MAG: hypothetical protein CM1200mP29_04310 [Verrucomicrobiota bacterium]
MLIAAEAIGATYGHVYLRSEYPEARAILQRRSMMRALLGCSATGRHGDQHRSGAYVCGRRQRS